jgi:hypothetical protein
VGVLAVGERYCAGDPVVGTKPVPCPVRGGHVTNLVITAPSKGG